MGEFSAKELEIIDFIVEDINCEIFSNDQNEIDIARLEYSLCSNNTEKIRATKKKVAKYKSKIDKCDPNIAGYMAELVRHNPEYVEDGEVRDNLTKNFVIDYYLELIEELALIGIEKIENFTLSSTVKSKGYSYKKIKNYIDAVSNITHYLNYKSFLETLIKEERELSKEIEEIGVKHEESTNAHFKSPINGYLEASKNEALPNIPQSKKLGDKWHALLYLLEVKVYNRQIPTNVEGSFIKSEIEKIGKQRCKNSGQGFYRQVKDLKDEIKDNISIKRHFNEDWKTVITELSNNDEKIIKYLDTF